MSSALQVDFLPLSHRGCPILEQFRFTEKLQREYREFLNTSHPVSSVINVFY